MKTSIHFVTYDIITVNHGIDNAISGGVYENIHPLHTEAVKFILKLPECNNQNS